MSTISQLLTFIFAVLVAAALQVGKANSAPMLFRVDPTSCRVVASGDIVLGTTRAFSRKVQEMAGAAGPGGCQQGGVVLLTSLGGDATEAVKLGREIRRRQMDTRVPSGGTCYSECLLTLIGGVNRFAAESSLAIGRLHVGETLIDIANDMSRPVMDMRKWLEEVGASPLLLSLFSAIPPDRIVWLPDAIRLALHLTEDPVRPVALVERRCTLGRDDEGDHDRDDDA